MVKYRKNYFDIDLQKSEVKGEEQIAAAGVEDLAQKEVMRQATNLQNTIANAVGTTAGIYISQEISAEVQKQNQQTYNTAQSQNGQQQSQAQLMSKYGINSNNNSAQTSVSASSGYGSGNTSATSKTDVSNATTTDLGTALAMAGAQVLANTPISQLAPDPSLFPTGSTNSATSVPSYSEIERMDSAVQIGFTNELGVTNTSPNNMNILEDMNYLYGSILGVAAKFIIPELNAVPTIAKLANKFSGLWSNNSVRTNIYNNIAENQAAIQSSNFQVLIAKETQFNAGYNPDTWNMVTLPKGTLVYGGLPGQTAYYTTLSTLDASNMDPETFGQSLQIRPDPNLGYRTQVGVYELTQDMRVPAGAAVANQQLGEGNGYQFYISNFSSSLKLTETIQLGENYDYQLSGYRPRP